jgi:guanylate kinase
MSSDTTDINGHTSLPENLAVNGILVVVSSPSGGGKGTLIRRALERVPNLGYSVSFTTRSPRQGEVDGRDYFFVSNETFQSMVAAGDFLEWAVVHGNYYGTACKQVISELKAGNDIILEIDVQGAESIRSVAPTAVRVFILPPSFEVLKARLINRGTEVPSNLELRLRNSRREVEHYTEFDYVVINDEADYAAAQLASIIIAERSRVERQRSAAARVLATFPTA